MKKLLLILVYGLIACDNSPKPINDSRLVGTYLSEGGSLGLAAGDSLIITTSEIHYRYAQIIGWDSITQAWVYEYEDWVTMNYVIDSDTTLTVSPALLYNDTDLNKYYYQTFSDTLDYACVSEGQLIISADPCNGDWGYVCCPSYWVKL